MKGGSNPLALPRLGRRGSRPRASASLYKPIMTESGDERAVPSVRGGFDPASPAANVADAAGLPCSGRGLRPAAERQIVRLRRGRMDQSRDAAAVRVFPPAVPLLAILMGVGLNRLWPLEFLSGLPAPACMDRWRHRRRRDSWPRSFLSHCRSTQRAE